MTVGKICEGGKAAVLAADRLPGQETIHTQYHETRIALYIAHYNYVRRHGTLKTSPAVASGIENHR